MKYILLCFLSIPICVGAQEILKKANRIIISNDKKAEDNFTLVKHLLSDKGIEIDSQDKEVFQIKTGIFKIDKYNSSGFYILKCYNKKISLVGKRKNSVFDREADPFNEISNKGMSGSPLKLSFESMNNFAKDLGDNVSYEIIE